MDQRIRKLYRELRLLRRLVLGMTLLLAVGLGLGLIAIGERFGLGVVRDLGIGLLVSVFVSITIELYASSSLRSALTAEMTEAIFQRLIPDAIWTQIATHIVRSNFMCKELELLIDVRRAGDDATVAGVQRKLREKYGASVHLVHYTAHWKVENITGATQAFPAAGGLDADLNLPDEGVPRFARFDVTGGIPDDVHIALADPTPAQAAATRSSTEFISPQVLYDLMASPESPAEKPLRLVTLRYRHNLDLGVWVNSLPEIPARKEIEISYEAWRGIRSPGVFVYTSGFLADGIRVRLTGPDDLTFRVRALHPDARAMEHRTDDDWWRLSKGILPGQGVAIYFAPKAGQPPTTRAVQTNQPPRSTNIQAQTPTSSSAGDTNLIEGPPTLGVSSTARPLPVKWS